LLAVIGAVMVSSGWKSASKSLVSMEYSIEGQQTFSEKCDPALSIQQMVFIFKEKGELEECKKQSAATKVNFKSAKNNESHSFDLAVTFNDTCGQTFEDIRKIWRPDNTPSLKASAIQANLPDIMVRRLRSDVYATDLYAEARRLEEANKELMGYFQFLQKPMKNPANEGVLQSRCEEGQYDVESSDKMWALLLSDKMEAFAAGFMQILGALTGAVALCCFGLWCAICGGCVALCSTPPGRVIG